jgi:iron complex transport system permease protein
MASWFTIKVARAASFRLDKRILPVFSLLLLVTLTVTIISVGQGEYTISPGDVIRAVLGINTGNDDHRLVVRLFRLPRILLALEVGAALAVSGAILQGITRNPLADPGILGINSGAALAAVAILVYLDNVPIRFLPWAALGGALVMAALIYLLAWRGGSSPIRLILIGIGLAAVANSLTTLMTVFGDINDVQQAFVWLAGSVYGRGWAHVQIMGWWLLLLLPLAILSARYLNTLALGDGSATGLGLAVEWARALLIMLSVALAASAVATAGTIGFVGLVAPHMGRRLVGPNHEALLPVSALLGGLIVLLADFIGRTIIAPSQLPAGIVTAIIGAPYFMILLWQNRDSF